MPHFVWIFRIENTLERMGKWEWPTCWCTTGRPYLECFVAYILAMLCPMIVVLGTHNYIPFLSSEYHITWLTSKQLTAFHIAFCSGNALSRILLIPISAAIFGTCLLPCTSTDFIHSKNYRFSTFRRRLVLYRISEKVTVLEISQACLKMLTIHWAEQELGVA